MPYPFLAPAPRTYPAYLDADTQGTLTAEPGGSYSMTSVAGHLPVPPGDGLWGPEIVTAEPPAAAAPAKASKSAKAAAAADGEGL